MLLVCCHSQIGLGLEIVVETPFVDICPLADVVHADSTVAVVPNQIESHLQQTFLRITNLRHTHIVNDLTDQSIKYSFLLKNAAVAVQMIALATWCPFPQLIVL